MVFRLVVLISGNGSNLQAIIDAVESSNLKNAQIVLVISNRKDAYGLQRAMKAQISTCYVNLLPFGKQFPSSDPTIKYGREAREAYDSALAHKVLDAQPDLVVCAGWMHILSTAFLDPLAKESVPILNLHPALPGEYDGANAIERAFDDFQHDKIERTGLMIHYVIREVDRGAPIVTREIEFQQDDDLEAVKNRIHAAEHQLIVQGIDKALQALRTN